MTPDRNQLAPDNFYTFFEERGMDSNLILIELFIKHLSHEEVASALEREYGLSITPARARCHVNQPNVEVEFVFRRWA